MSNSLPEVSTRVQQMNAALRAHYTLSPLVHIEQLCDQKRMAALATTADELHTAQLAVFAAFNDFNFCYSHGGNQITYNFLAGLYGSLAKRLKEWAAMFKKYNKQPEIVSFGQFAADHALNVDVYAMMKSDFAGAEPVFKSRHEELLLKYPLFTTWGSVEFDWDTINARFKQAR